MKITIYQENNPMFRVDDEQKVYEKAHYHKVYEMDWNRYELPKDENILETLWSVFNNPPYPESYKGHSMSVGDIVELDDRVYICASIGWNKVEWGKGDN